jgi:hypothetical protein
VRAGLAPVLSGLAPVLSGLAPVLSGLAPVLSGGGRVSVSREERAGRRAGGGLAVRRRDRG